MQVIRKLFPRPGETSLANALRSALRPDGFKMTSMGLRPRSLNVMTFCGLATRHDSTAWDMMPG